MHRDVAMVFQSYALYPHMTVADNMSFGLKLRRFAAQVIEEKIGSAAKTLNLLPYLARLPGQLSGGQRQRVAIARALLIDPRLLILDDSTSAVDAETEAAIQETLDRLMRERHRTVFVIAQRVSTVRDADLILVLDDGRIAARGTHEELLEDSELYNEILGSQLLSPTAA
jgi:ABC-type multidrug transport system fused ATPase/permease subunit